MSAYRPIGGTPPQYSKDGDELASGYYLKFFDAGTTTPLSMATDTTGGTTLAKCKLNTAGYPLSNDADDTTVFVPHLNADYKVSLFPTSADADANTNATWTVDNLSAGEGLNFLTLAALKAAATLTTGEIYSTVEYASGTGYGGARYEYDSSSSATADDGKVIALDTLSGRLLLIENEVYLEHYGAVPDGATNSNTAFSNAVANNSVLYGSVGTYMIDSADLSSAIIIVGAGRGSTIIKARSAVGALDFLDLTASNTTLRDLTVDMDNTDTTFASGFTADRNGIYAHGASQAAKISNIQLDNVEVKNCGEAGIKFQYVEDSEIAHPYIHRCGQYGVYGLTCDNIVVSDFHIDDIFPGNGGTTPYLNAYGITFTYSGSDNASTQCRAENGLVENVVTWEAYDSHGGKNISFINCSSNNCGQGVAIESTAAGYESDDVQVIGGRHDGYGQSYSYRTQTFEAGPAVVANMGSSTTNGRNLSIVGVQADSHGSGGDSSDGAITIQDVDGWSVTGCVLTNSLKRGFAAREQCLAGVFTGNSVKTVTTVGSVSYAAEFSSETQAYVDGNTTDGINTQAFRSVTPASSTYGTKFGRNHCIDDDCVNAITDGVAISVEPYYELTTITTTGAASPTLADGIEGQRRKITMITDGGDATLSPTSTPANYTSIVFNDVGDTVDLLFTGGVWIIAGNYGPTIS